MFDFINFEDRDTAWFDIQQKQHLYLSRPWLESLKVSYDFEVLLVVDADDRYQTAFCKLDDMMGKRLISLPFSDYIPYTNSDPAYFDELFKSCAAHFPEYEILLKTDRETHLLEMPYKLVKEAVFHSIDLTSDEMPKQNSAFTRGVKQAKKNDILIRKVFSIEAVKEFYCLYHRLRFDKFNIIPQPFSFFENLWETMISQERGTIFEAVYKDKVIASMIILQHNGTAYYKYGCSHNDYLNLKPNNLLFDELITYYKSLGYKNIDLGLSGVGDGYAGLRRWKSSMGGDESPISYWSYIPPENKTDRVQVSKNKNTINKLTGAMVKADLDADQTSLLSEQLYGLLA